MQHSIKSVTAFDTRAIGASASTILKLALSGRSRCARILSWRGRGLRGAPRRARRKFGPPPRANKQ